MDEILHQLEPLLLGSVPTMIIFILLVFAYKFLVHDPLLRILAERRSRTQGAIEKAHAAIAAADARAQEYEARLRAARTEIFRAREQRVQHWNAERDRALESARQVARERVHTAKMALDQQAQSAKQQLDHAAADLAADILKAILPDGIPAGAELAAEVAR